MDEDVLRAKGLDPRAVEPASVEGFALRIGERAALVPNPGSRVHGLVVSLTVPEVERLYAEPSVQAYRPQAVLARLASGGVIAALCYNLPQPPSPGERNPEYAARLRSLAARLGLPDDYVATIE